MFWTILLILFIIYVIFSLSTIKQQLNELHKKIDGERNEKPTDVVSNEEIEKMLNDELNK